MASKDLYLRSLADKSETSNNLRLRSDANKIPVAGWTNTINKVASPYAVCGVLASNISKVNGV